MNILALSTSSNVCSVALVKDTLCIKELNIDDKKTHSEHLMPLIKELLDGQNMSLKNIDLIAVDVGPGSFTGIRIGIGTAKGLAMPNNIPIATVSSLEALAYNAQDTKGHICSLIDARNNQVYCGLFDSEYTLCEDYMADDINNVMSKLKTYDDITFVRDEDNNIHAENVGIAGYRKYASGLKESADTIVPLYLRPSQAERMRKGQGHD